MLAKRFDPVTLVRSPTTISVESGRTVSVSSPEKCVMVIGLGSRVPRSG